MYTGVTATLIALVDRARAEVLRRFQQVPRRTARPIQRAKRRTQEPAGFFTTAGRVVSLAPYWRELTGSARKTLFDADYYGHPLLHFLVEGAYQGRQPHRLFDPGFYLDRHPDLRRAGLNPQVHYVRHGATEDRKPLPLFEPSHYRKCCAEAPGRGQNLLAHFLESGAGAASPHPLLDCEAYLDAHPDAAAQGANPLVDYLLSDSGRPVSPMPESAALAPIDIQDVQVTVVLLAGSLDSKTREERRAIHEAWKGWAARQGMSGSVALVWPAAGGLAQWLADPQQPPFLAAVSLEQIRAQWKRGQTHLLPNPQNASDLFS